MKEPVGGYFEPFPYKPEVRENEWECEDLTDEQEALHNLMRKEPRCRYV